MPIDALVALIPAGIDVGYVLEGRRQKPLELSAAERTLVERYRSLDSDGQRRALGLLLSLIETSTPGAIRTREQKKPLDASK